MQIGLVFFVLFEGALEEGRFVVLFLARHLEKLEIILSERLLHSRVVSRLVVFKIDWIRR